MFYVYSQNNSGGSFVVDNDVAHYVVVEADSEQDADDKAESVGIYFNGCDNGQDCDCCGDRWNTASSYGSSKELSIYGKSLSEYVENVLDEKQLFWKDVIVYFKDDRKLAVHFVDKKATIKLNGKQVDQEVLKGI